MIASVVATLDVDDGSLPQITDQIAGLPNVEAGDFVAASCRLPIAIDSPNPAALEELTRELQKIPGVAFVDVVYVQFEDNVGIEGDLAGVTSANTQNTQRSDTP